MVKCVRVFPAIVILGSILTGCSSDTGSRAYVARAEPEAFAATPETLPVNGADASMMLAQMPPPGGRVRKVREKIYPNGVAQQAVLEDDRAGMGENHLEISVQTNSARGAGLLGIGRPSEAGIRREIQARYPHVDMRIVTQPRHNELGVFGLAIGRASNGARCVFAWQWVDDLRNPGVAGGFARLGGSGDAVPASIRVHLCRKGVTADDLAATVEGLTVAPPAVVARVLDSTRGVALVEPVRRVGTGSTIADGSLESALGPEKRVMTAAAAPRAARSRPRLAQRRMPAPRRNDVERTVAPVEQAYSGGARYLAPVGGAAPMGAAAPPSYSPPATMASAAAPARGLDPSLPAAAYRGPVSRGY